MGRDISTVLSSYEVLDERILLAGGAFFIYRSYTHNYVSADIQLPAFREFIDSNKAELVRLKGRERDYYYDMSQTRKFVRFVVACMLDVHFIGWFNVDFVCFWLLT